MQTSTNIERTARARSVGLSLLLTVLVALVAGVLLLVFARAAQAAEVDELEPNDTIAQAQDLDASFDLSENAEIADSTTVPHATVNGTGGPGDAGSVDYYSFTVPEGDRVGVILDIDNTAPLDIMDSWIELYDSSGELLEFNDDGYDFNGNAIEDPGSEGTTLDSYLERTLAPGTYYVGVGTYPDFGVIVEGEAYQLHVSFAVALADTTPPDTTITEGPAETVENDSATFRFETSEDATFECRLDEEAFTDCSSPQNYTGLSLGSHTFEVQATDEAGNVETEPASHTWTIVDLTAPTVLSTTPTNGATKVSLTNPNITATFSEAMAEIPADSFTLQKVSVRGKNESPIGDPVSISVVQSSPTVVTVTPAVTLDKGSYYRVTISTDITDLAGNLLEAEGSSWRFKTAPR